MASTWRILLTWSSEESKTTLELGRCILMHLLFTADEICDTLGQLSWFLVFCSRHQISLIKLREGIREVAGIAKTKSLKPQVPKYKIYPSFKCPSIHVPKFQSIQVPKFWSSQVPKIPNCQVSKFPSSPIRYLRLSVFWVIFAKMFEVRKFGNPRGRPDPIPTFPCSQKLI